MNPKSFKIARWSYSVRHIMPRARACRIYRFYNVRGTELREAYLDEFHNYEPSDEWDDFFDE